MGMIHMLVKKVGWVNSVSFLRNEKNLEKTKATILSVSILILVIKQVCMTETDVIHSSCQAMLLVMSIG